MTVQPKHHHALAARPVSDAVGSGGFDWCHQGPYQPTSELLGRNHPAFDFSGFAIPDPMAMKSFGYKERTLSPLSTLSSLPSTNMGKHLLPKKTKKRTWKRQKGRPKRPLSAYNLFFQSERAKIVQSAASEEPPRAMDGSRRHRKSHGKIGFAELARNVSEKWKQIDAKSRAPFEEKAAIEKARYKREIEAWNKARGFGSKKEGVVCDHGSEAVGRKKSPTDNKGAAGKKPEYVPSNKILFPESRGESAGIVERKTTQQRQRSHFIGDYSVRKGAKKQGLPGASLEPQAIEPINVIPRYGTIDSGEATSNLCLLPLETLAKLTNIIDEMPTCSYQDIVASNSPDKSSRQQTIKRSIKTGYVDRTKHETSSRMCDKQDPEADLNLDSSMRSLLASLDASTENFENNMDELFAVLKAAASVDNDGGRSKGTASNADPAANCAKEKTTAERRSTIKRGNTNRCHDVSSLNTLPPKGNSTDSDVNIANSSLDSTNRQSDLSVHKEDSFNGNHSKNSVGDSSIGNLSMLDSSFIQGMVKSNGGSLKDMSLVDLQISLEKLDASFAENSSVEK